MKKIYLFVLILFFITNIGITQITDISNIKAIGYNNNGVLYISIFKDSNSNSNSNSNSDTSVILEGGASPYIFYYRDDNDFIKFTSKLYKNNSSVKPLFDSFSSSYNIVQIAKANNTLYLGTDNGIITLTDTIITSISIKSLATCNEDTLWFVDNNNKLYSLDLKTNTIQKDDRGDIKWLQKDSKNNLWLLHSDGKLSCKTFYGEWIDNYDSVGGNTSKFLIDDFETIWLFKRNSVQKISLSKKEIIKGFNSNVKYFDIYDSLVVLASENSVYQTTTKPPDISNVIDIKLVSDTICQNSDIELEVESNNKLNLFIEVVIKKGVVTYNTIDFDTIIKRNEKILLKINNDYTGDFSVNVTVKSPRFDLVDTTFNLYVVEKPIIDFKIIENSSLLCDSQVVVVDNSSLSNIDSIQEYLWEINNKQNKKDTLNFSVDEKDVKMKYKIKYKIKTKYCEVSIDSSLLFHTPNCPEITPNITEICGEQEIQFNFGKQLANWDVNVNGNEIVSSSDSVFSYYFNNPDTVYDTITIRAADSLCNDEITIKVKHQPTANFDTAKTPNVYTKFQLKNKSKVNASKVDYSWKIYNTVTKCYTEIEKDSTDISFYNEDLYNITLFVKEDGCSMDTTKSIKYNRNNKHIYIVVYDPQKKNVKFIINKIKANTKNTEDVVTIIGYVPIKGNYYYTKKGHFIKKKHWNNNNNNNTGIIFDDSDISVIQYNTKPDASTSLKFTKQTLKASLSFYQLDKDTTISFNFKAIKTQHITRDTIDVKTTIRIFPSKDADGVGINKKLSFQITNNRYDAVFNESVEISRYIEKDLKNNKFSMRKFAKISDHYFIRQIDTLIHGIEEQDSLEKILVIIGANKNKTDSLVTKNVFISSKKQFDKILTDKLGIKNSRNWSWNTYLSANSIFTSKYVRFDNNNINYSNMFHSVEPNLDFSIYTRSNYYTVDYGFGVNFSVSYNKFNLSKTTYKKSIDNVIDRDNEIYTSIINISDLSEDILNYTLSPGVMFFFNWEFIDRLSLIVIPAVNYTFSFIRKKEVTGTFTFRGDYDKYGLLYDIDRYGFIEEQNLTFDNLDKKISNEQFFSGSIHVLISYNINNISLWAGIYSFSQFFKKISVNNFNNKNDNLITHYNYLQYSGEIKQHDYSSMYYYLGNYRKQEVNFSIGLNYRIPSCPKNCHR